MEKLQEIIDKKAKLKLENELHELHNLIWNKFYELFRDSGIMVNIGTNDKPNVINVVSIFGSSGLKNKIYEANIEKYIANESKNFIKQVEDLQSQIDALYEN